MDIERDEFLAVEAGQSRFIRPDPQKAASILRERHDIVVRQAVRGGIHVERIPLADGDLTICHENRDEDGSDGSQCHCERK